jgi:hypothetical protein
LLAYEPQTCTVSSASAYEQQTSRASTAVGSARTRTRRGFVIQRRIVSKRSGADDHDVDALRDVAAARVKCLDEQR